MTCGLSPGERRAKLTAEHGAPRMLRDTAAALRLIGKRDKVHPVDAIAFAYRDHLAAAAWSASNRVHNGVPPLGIAVGGDEVIAVLDMRPALSAHGAWKPADPSLPDDWQPHRNREAS
jgi:hypothetical protein